MIRPLANSLLLLSVVLLALTAVTLSGACKSEASCTSSDQCANGFACNTDNQRCESVAAGTDAGPDATAQACPEQTHFCATPAPEGWSGPVVGTEVASDVELAACPEAFGAGEQIVFSGFVEEGGCSCECPGVPASVLCSNAILTGITSTSPLACSSPTSCNPFSACAVSLPPTGVCQNQFNDGITEAPKVHVSLGRVTNSGMCSAAITGDDLSAEFAAQARYCSADALDASCPAAGSCLPSASDESFDSVCIFQAGDNECPAEYPEKRVRFTDMEDTRSCSECECLGPPVGNSCGGSVSMDFVTTSSPSCTGATATGGCVAKTAGQAIAAKYSPETNFACSPTGAELSGEAAATGPVTFCCLADG